MAMKIWKSLLAAAGAVAGLQVETMVLGVANTGILTNAWFGLSVGTVAFAALGIWVGDWVADKLKVE